VAPVVGNPIEPAGTVVPANALHFAAGVATATLAGAESLPPQPDTAIADAANKALTIAELRRLLNRVLILVSVYFYTAMSGSVACATGRDASFDLPNASAVSACSAHRSMSADLSFHEACGHAPLNRMSVRARRDWEKRIESFDHSDVQAHLNA
jgi:hypothetical protein